MADMARYSVAWRNPYTQPPEGGPRVIAAMLVPRGQPAPEELQQLLREKGLGSGWCLCWELITQKPVRRWSQEARARVRKLNLRRRIEKRFPLFAEDFIAAEIASRPSYYEGSNDFRP